MKRKVKRYDTGGPTYEKEDEGLLGGKINYREDDEGRKFVAGRANPFDRNPAEQRYYSKDDVKKGLSNIGDKISNFFSGKKEDSPSKFDELESVGGAGRRPRTIQEQIGGKSEEAPIRKMTDRMINKPEPFGERQPSGGRLFVNQEADKSEADKSEKKAKKVASDDRKVTPLPGKGDDKVKKPTPLPGKDIKSTRMPIGYDKLDPRSPEEKYKPGISKERQEKADKAVYAGWRKNKIDMTKRKSAEDMKYDEQGNAYKRGGSVKSASARADGCAIRGKTRA
jgi:hypothetical protein